MFPPMTLWEFEVFLLFFLNVIQKLKFIFVADIFGTKVDIKSHKMSPSILETTKCNFPKITAIINWNWTAMSVAYQTMRTMMTNRNFQFLMPRHFNEH